MRMSKLKQEIQMVTFFVVSTHPDPQIHMGYTEKARWLFWGGGVVVAATRSARNAGAIATGEKLSRRLSSATGGTRITALSAHVGKTKKAVKEGVLDCASVLPTGETCATSTIIN
jgi:hypothetical protein